jgi:hypothetical protein
MTMQSIAGPVIVADRDLDDRSPLARLAMFADAYVRARRTIGLFSQPGWFDIEVIDPAHTRRRLAEALASAPAGRGHHGNIPL